MMPKILVVEDHPEDVAPVLRAWLEGYELLFERRADRVLLLMKTHPDIAVILLDLQFDTQQWQGPDVIRALRENRHLVPVIILATTANLSLAQQLKEENKNHHSFVKDEVMKDKLRQEDFLHRIADAIEAGVRQRKLQALQIAFLDDQHKVLVGDAQLHLNTMQYALYRTIARAAKEQWPGVGPAGFGDKGWLAYSDFFAPHARAAQEFVMLWSGHNLKEAAQKIHKHMTTAGNETFPDDARDIGRYRVRQLLSPCISKINRELERQLRDMEFAGKCKIHRISRRRGGKPASTFGLLLSPTEIRL